MCCRNTSSSYSRIERNPIILINKVHEVAVDIFPVQSLRWEMFKLLQDINGEIYTHMGVLGVSSKS